MRKVYPKFSDALFGFFNLAAIPPYISIAGGRLADLPTSSIPFLHPRFVMPDPSKFRAEMSPEEQREFLTRTRLYLSKDIKRVVWANDIYVLKHVPTGSRMRVSAEHLFILGQFGRGMMLSELVPQLIMNRRCLPLAELYELILRAREANILNEQRDEEYPVRYPLAWWPSLSAGTAQLIWTISVWFLAIVMLYWVFSTDAPGLFDHLRWYDVFVAWFFASICASMGGLLASAYVRHAGGDVRAPGFIWKSVIPRVGFDWHDVDMLGAEGHRIVAKMRILPFLLAAALCTVVPSLRIWAAVSACLLLWRISPFPFSASSQWIAASRRRPLLTTDRPALFYHFGYANTERFWREFLLTDWRFVPWIVGWSVVWAGGALWFTGALMKAKDTKSEGLIPPIFECLFSEDSLGTLKLASPLLILVLVGSAVALVNGWWRLRARMTQVAHDSDGNDGAMEVSKVIEDCALFREIPVEIRSTLAGIAKLVHVPAGEKVVSGDDSADCYLVASGSVLIEQERPSSKSDRVAVLMRGDLFGTPAFFGPVFRPQNARAASAVALVAFPSSELEALLKRHISVPIIEEILQRRVFLRRIELSAGWESDSISRFAKLARLEPMREGQVVIGAGRENRFFYLVYGGSMEVKRRGRRVDRIVPGRFFGELPLLLNKTSSSDIIAESGTLCLVLQKSDFLSLMGSDIRLALQMEHLASINLGRPIFPFDGASIEALAN